MRHFLGWKKHYKDKNNLLTLDFCVLTIAKYFISSVGRFSQEMLFIILLKSADHSRACSRSQSYRTKRPVRSS